MKQKLIRILSGLLMASFFVAACSPAATTAAPTAVPATAVPATAAPAATDTQAAAATTAPSGSFKGNVCEVTDTGGVDDKSFNALGWQGAQDAAKDVGTTAAYLESKQQTDY